jgi:hypothetical protein
MAAVPFQIKQKDKLGPWQTVLNGKTIVLAGPDATKEEATEALRKLSPISGNTSTPETKKSFNLLGQVKSTATTPGEESLNSTASTATPSPTNDKPKPGELRKNGLAELSPAKLAAFKSQVAGAIAAGNVSLDRALVGLFRDKVPVIPPESYMLLATGWELACEQYFVSGVPPWWAIALLGNATVIAAMYEKSEPKPPEDALGRPIATAANRPTSDK